MDSYDCLTLGVSSVLKQGLKRRTDSSLACGTEPIELIERGVIVSDGFVSGFGLRFFMRDIVEI